MTFCTNERRPIFTEAELVDVVCTQILRAADERDYAAIVYGFMPDHLHLLVDGSKSGVPLSCFVKHAKQLAGYHGKQASDGRVWQRGFYDRVLRPDEDVRPTIA